MPSRYSCCPCAAPPRQSLTSALFPTQVARWPRDGLSVICQHGAPPVVSYVRYLGAVATTVRQQKARRTGSRGSKGCCARVTGVTTHCLACMAFLRARSSPRPHSSESATEHGAIQCMLAISRLALPFVSVVRVVVVPCVHTALHTTRCEIFAGRQTTRAATTGCARSLHSTPSE